MKKFILLIVTAVRQYKQRTTSVTGRITFHPDVTRGDDVRLTGDVNFGSEPFLIRLGSRVTSADGVRFNTHEGALRVLRDDIPDLPLHGPISAGNDAFVGDSAFVMPNVSMEDRSIGASSVVTHSVPTGKVWSGVPACKIHTATSTERRQ